MSDDPQREPESELGAAPRAARGPQPGDVPVPVIAVVVTIALLAFGFVGVKRYQAMRAETLRLLAEEHERENARLREELDERAAAKAAADAAAAASTVEAGDAAKAAERGEDSTASETGDAASTAQPQGGKGGAAR